MGRFTYPYITGPRDQWSLHKAKLTFLPFFHPQCRFLVGGGKDVLLSIPDESIVPYCLESMVSAICVAGTYEGNNKFKLTVCVTVILKVLAQVEVLIPSYGFCPIPPCEEFAENVCDEFFSLPLFPHASLCNNDEVSIQNASCTMNGCGCGCRR